MSHSPEMIGKAKSVNPEFLAHIRFGNEIFLTFGSKNFCFHFLLFLFYFFNFLNYFSLFATFWKKNENKKNYENLKQNENSKNMKISKKWSSKFRIEKSKKIFGHTKANPEKSLFCSENYSHLVQNFQFSFFTMFVLFFQLSYLFFVIFIFSFFNPKNPVRSNAFGQWRQSNVNFWKIWKFWILFLGRYRKWANRGWRKKSDFSFWTKYWRNFGRIKPSDLKPRYHYQNQLPTKRIYGKYM